MVHTGDNVSNQRNEPKKVTLYSNRTSPNMQRLQEVAKASKSVNSEVNAFGRLRLQKSNPARLPVLSKHGVSLVELINHNHTEIAQGVAV